MLDACSRERSKTYVMSTQWMCGFPDKLVVASLDGNLIVACFGAEDLVDTFRDKLADGLSQRARSSLTRPSIA